MNWVKQGEATEKEEKAIQGRNQTTDERRDGNGM